MVQYKLLVKVDFASSCCFSLLVSVKMFLEVLQIVVLRDICVCVKYYQLICVFALSSVNV